LHATQEDEEIMTTVQLRRLIDEQNTLWHRMQEIQGAAETEARDWTAEERQNWDKADARITEVSGDIDRLERMANLGSIDHRQALEGQGTDESRKGGKGEPDEAAFGEAFGRWLRGGMDYCTSEQRQLMHRNAAQGEQRAYQGVTTPSLGGYLVPDGFRQTMVESLLAFGGLMNHANVINTATGNTLSWPTNDDTANVGAILDENTVLSEQATSIGTRSVGAYTYTSKLVRVSLQLLQDSVFDLDSWLPRKLGERIGRAVADDLVNGTGTGEPTGLLPTSTAATITTVTSANFRANASGAGYDAIIELEHSVDPAYRQSGRCRYLFNDNTLSILRKFKDADYRPLWLPVPVPGQPATINGLPYSIDQAMPSQSTTSKFILFGDFNAGFLVRQALDVQAMRLTERYADYLQVGFFGFMRLDAVPDDAGAVRHLACSS
jgi:HK97 family phage major capsid protein